MSQNGVKPCPTCGTDQNLLTSERKCKCVNKLSAPPPPPIKRKQNDN
ncbi:hypothetical protein Phi14:2_gp018 [Cellulophaga phage phi14:2]|uniref:Uncharacterized protein n=1 Tax=Cellulophaga phage phi14:2 TaxID=1327990 RepID=S0A0J4_9CAUD|nr:hypothetical protein Phi14:2_gp018 [Cellulophaga phage phi14:2]